MFGGMNWRFTLLSVALLYATGVAVVRACSSSKHRDPAPTISGGSGTKESDSPANADAKTPPQAKASSQEAVATSSSPVAASGAEDRPSSLSLVQVHFMKATQPLNPQNISSSFTPSVDFTLPQVVRCICSDGMLAALTLLSMTNKYGRCHRRST